MGRSASCFKIMTCAGSDSAEQETGDLDVFENKSSSDKRGWSFRKKSVRHRVLNNTVISETPTSGNKQTLESALLKSPSPDNSGVLEKVCAVQSTEDKTQLPVPFVVQVQPTEDKTQLLVHGESKASESGDEVSRIKKEIDYKINSKASEADDDVSGAEKEIDCTVNSKASEYDDDAIRTEQDIDCTVSEKPDESAVIIIQAAVRDFLARRELLKLKKVVKLQAAVRGHLVRRHAIGALRCVQAIVKMQALVRARRAQTSMEDSLGSVVPDKENSAINLKATSVDKLLQNKFARQLMESTPKTKPIGIKCDPSKPNSAWKWLERWMSVSSAEKASKPNLATEEKERTETVTSPVEISSNVPQEITGSKSVTESSVPLESKENLITYEADKINPHVLQTSVSVEQPHFEDAKESFVMETSIEVDSHPNQSHPSDGTELSSLPKKLELESEQPKHSLKRKVSNPAFIAAQSKFEELTSKKSYKDVVVGENKKEESLSVSDTVKIPKELSSVEDEARGVRVQLAGSECGTELSISSTLDSPDNRSEVGALELEHETKLPEQGTQDSDKVDKPCIDVNETTLSDSIEQRLEKLDDHVKDGVGGTVVSEIEQKPKLSTPDVKKFTETEQGNQTYPSSPEASSPRTVTESQATPASQVSSSVKSKKNKNCSNQRRKVSSSASKRSPSNPKYDSGGVSSVEKMPKDHNKSGKRRNSFGFDQEPRESSGGNSSLPRFMQPTESARAKVEQNSPRSSPDVQEREVYIKKRHSLPGANGKQGSSPRIQRSMSQAQQGTKERKWQR